MLNADAVINAVAVTGYSQGAIDKAMIDFSINPADDYTTDSSLIVNKAAIQVLKGMLAVAEISEGDFDLKYSITGIQARIADLEGQTGVVSNSQPVIRNKSFLW